MRFVAFPLIWTTVLGLSTPGHMAAADPETSTDSIKIVRLWSAYRDEPSFVRFGALREESSEPGAAIVLRSNPEKHDGYYFTIRLRSASRRESIPDGEVRLQVVAPDESDAKTFSFTYSGNGKSSIQLLVGLTGPDWTHDDVMPLAWRFEFLDLNGRLLADRSSFLWEKPAPAGP